MQPGWTWKHPDLDRPCPKILPRTLQGWSGLVLTSPRKVGQLQSTSVNHMDIEKKVVNLDITLFRLIVMFYGTESILENILHIQAECEECSIEKCQSHA